MDDEYKQLSKCLSDLINLLKDFEISKDDYKKPIIRADLIKIISIGKTIGDKVQSHVEKLNSDIDEYLIEPKKEKYLLLIKDAINLQNDLWEL